MFLTLMVVGLVGLLVMAIPAFAHSHVPPAHGGPALPGHGAVHHGVGAAAGAHAHGAPVGAHAHGASGAGAGRLDGAPLATRILNQELVPADPAHASRLRFIPSPRAIFSVFALYGAFGNALVHAAHLSFIGAVLAAAAPAFLVERLVIRPVWNLVFRFQGQPSSPFEALVLAECQATVPFRNGRGMIATVRDGRRVELAAVLRSDQSLLPVKVGERMRIEDVDAARERVTVSVLRD